MTVLAVASDADVLRGSSRVPTHRGAGTRDEPLRTSALEATVFGRSFLTFERI